MSADNRNRNDRRPPSGRPRRPGNGRRPESGSSNPKSSYERYLALARAAASNGDATETEYYYQHAEHYFRVLMAKQPG